MAFTAPPCASHDDTATPIHLTRRGLFRTATGVAVGATLATGFAGQAAAAFPGSISGQVYLGMSCSSGWDSAVSMTGPVGLRRSFGNWDADSRQMRLIAEDHAANRMPWISFKDPIGNASGWREVASGKHDAELRARARRYKALPKPVILTYHHEPGDGGTQAEGKDYAAAWCRIYDLFQSEGALSKVCMAPILSDWLFQPRNLREDPKSWITPAMLSRISSGGFMGVDVYQNKSNAGVAERLGQVLSWLSSQGYPEIQVGVGEMASCQYFGSTPKPENWLRDGWAWVESNSDKVAAMSYFHSTANSKSGHDWRLNEPGTTKLATFQAMLDSPVSIGL